MSTTTGTVKWFNDEKGYGFMRFMELDEEGLHEKEVFFHHSHLVEDYPNHLLTHTSGIPSYTSLSEWWPLVREDLTVGEIIGEGLKLHSGKNNASVRDSVDLAELQSKVLASLEELTFEGIEQLG